MKGEQHYLLLPNDDLIAFPSDEIFEIFEVFVEIDEMLSMCKEEFKSAYWRNNKNTELRKKSYFSNFSLLLSPCKYSVRHNVIYNLVCL